PGVLRLQLDISEHLEAGVEEGEPRFGPAHIDANVTDLGHQKINPAGLMPRADWLSALAFVLFAVVLIFFRLVGLLLFLLPVGLLLAALGLLSVRLLPLRLLTLIRFLLLFSGLMALFLLALFHRILFGLIFLFHEWFSFLSCWLLSCKASAIALNE